MEVVGRPKVPNFGLENSRWLLCAEVNYTPGWVPAKGHLLTSDDPLIGLLKVLLLHKRTQVVTGDQGCFIANIGISAPGPGKERRLPLVHSGLHPRKASSQEARGKTGEHMKDTGTTLS